jgi:hypothetical protein
MDRIRSFHELSAEQQVNAGGKGRVVLAEKCHPCMDQPVPPSGDPFDGPYTTGFIPLRPSPLAQG